MIAGAAGCGGRSDRWRPSRGGRAPRSPGAGRGSLPSVAVGTWWAWEGDGSGRCPHGADPPRPGSPGRQVSSGQGARSRPVTDDATAVTGAATGATTVVTVVVTGAGAGVAGRAGAWCRLGSARVARCGTGRRHLGGGVGVGGGPDRQVEVDRLYGRRIEADAGLDHRRPAEVEPARGVTVVAPVAGSLAALTPAATATGASTVTVAAAVVGVASAAWCDAGVGEGRVDGRTRVGGGGAGRRVSLRVEVDGSVGDIGDGGCGIGGDGRR